MHVLLIFLIGCPTSSSDSGDDAGKTPSFEPSEGAWDGGDYSVKKDSCGLFEDQSTSTDLDIYTLELRNSGGFDLSVQQDEFTVTWNCDLTKKDFDCPAQVLAVEDASSQGLDATITVTGAVAGAFSSEDAASVDISVNGACDGKDCGTLAAVAGIDFPCVAELTQPVTHTK